MQAGLHESHFRNAVVLLPHLDAFASGQRLHQLLHLADVSSPIVDSVDPVRVGLALPPPLVRQRLSLAPREQPGY